jgi:hypothetical protein
VTEKPPQKNGENLRKLEPSIQRLKNKIDFHLQEPSTNQKYHNFTNNAVENTDLAGRAKTEGRAPKTNKERRSLRVKTGQNSSRGNKNPQARFLQQWRLAATSRQK